MKMMEELLPPVGKFSTTPFIFLCQPADLKSYTQESKNNLSREN